MMDHYHYANQSYLMDSSDGHGSPSPSLHQLSSQQLQRNVSKKSPLTKINKTEQIPTDRGVKPTDMVNEINRESIYYATGDRTIKVSTQTLENLLMDEDSADGMMNMGPTNAPNPGDDRERRNSHPKSSLPNLIGPSQSKQDWKAPGSNSKLDIVENHYASVENISRKGGNKPVGRKSLVRDA